MDYIFICIIYYIYIYIYIYYIYTYDYSGYINGTYRGWILPFEMAMGSLRRSWLQLARLSWRPTRGCYLASKTSGRIQKVDPPILG